MSAFFCNKTEFALIGITKHGEFAESYQGPIVDKWIDADEKIEVMYLNFPDYPRAGLIVKTEDKLYFLSKHPKRSYYWGKVGHHTVHVSINGPNGTIRFWINKNTENR